MLRDHDALLAFLAERRTMPFGYRDGQQDCARFAAGAVEAQTGRKVLWGLRWGTEAGAARVIARLGGLEAAVDARLKPVAPAMAQRGDVAGVEMPDGLTLGVVEGETVVMAGEGGLMRLPRTRLVKAWSATDA